MGTSLTGNTIASSYLGLLKSTDSLAISTTAKTITDGAGNDLPIKLSTNQMLFGTGSASVPALSFNGNTSEGFYIPTDENIGVTIAGSEVARFLSTGLSLTSSKLTLSNDQKVRWTSDDVYIQGTTSADNIQLGVGGATQFTFAQTTGMRLHQYGSGNITGTVTQRLGVTSTGQVVEIPIGAGALDGSGTAGKLSKFTDSDTLADSIMSESGDQITLTAGTPSFKLSDSSSGGSTTHTLDGINYTLSNLSTNGHIILSTNGTGGIGMNLTSPTARLQVRTTADTPANILANGDYGLIVDGDTSGTNGKGVGIHISGISAEPTAIRGVSLIAERLSTGNQHDLIIATSANASAPSERVRVTNDGLVGINTSIPARPLSVNSTQISARFTSSSADSQIELADSSGTAVLGSSSGAFLVQTGSATRLTISTSGDATFAGDITISNATPSLTLTDTDNSSNITFSSIGGVSVIDASTQTFNIGGSEKMRLDSTGLGIGTTSPSSLLHLFRNDTSTSEILIENDGTGDSALAFRSDNNTDGNNFASIYFDANDEGNNNTRYAKIRAFIEDNASGAEDGKLVFTTLTGASDNNQLILDSSGATFAGIVGMGATGIYTSGTTAQLNLPSYALAIKNNRLGNNNNWSYIRNTATGDQANLEFTSGVGIALTLNHDKTAIFTTQVNVGTTDNNVTNNSVSGAGVNLGIAGIDGTIATARVDGSMIYTNRLNTDGTAIEIMKDGTTVGVIGTQNWGIGTSTPTNYYSGADNLVVSQASGEGGISIVTATNTTGALYFADGVSGSEQYRGGIFYNHSNDSLGLVSSGSTKVTLDSSGNFLVAKTAVNNSTVGLELKSDGSLNPTVNGDTVARFNRLTSDGEIIRLQKDTTTVGSFGSTTSYFNSNLGVGTTSPSGNLDILGASSGVSAHFPLIEATAQNTSQEGIHVTTTGTGNDFYALKIATGSNSNTLMVTNAGRVGIGTDSPDAIIETSSSATGNAVGALLTNTNGSGTADSVSLNFGLGRSADSLIFSIPAIKLLKEQQWTGTASTVDASLVFSTVSDETTSERMRITSEGKIQTQTSGGYYLTENTTNAFSITSNGANGYFRIRDEYNSSDRIRIDSNGNVGLSTTNPTMKLTIAHADQDGLRFTCADGLETFIDFGDASDNDIGRISYDHADNHMAFRTNNSERARIDSSGNLSLDSATSLDFNVSDFAQIKFKESGAIMIDSDNNQSSRNFQIKDGSGSSLLTVLDTGNVGIGTTSPASYNSAANHLVVAGTGNTGLTIAGGTSNDSNIFFADGTSGAEAYRGIIRFQHSDDSMLFFTPDSSSSTAERARINSSGNLGLGTSTIRQRLHQHVADSGSNYHAFTNSTTGTDVADGFVVGINASESALVWNQENTELIFATNNTERARITSGGNFLVGCTSLPSTSVEGFVITGTNSGNFSSSGSSTSAYNHLIFRNANDIVGFISTSGSATTYSTTSDYRLKEDLQDFNALEIASKIKMYDFKWKADDSRSYGVMAHELQEVVPQAVSGEKNGEDMQQVDYSKLVPILLKSIQELEARVKELEKEI